MEKFVDIFCSKRHQHCVLYSIRDGNDGGFVYKEPLREFRLADGNDEIGKKIRLAFDDYTQTDKTTEELYEDYSFDRYSCCIGVSDQDGFEETYQTSIIIKHVLGKFRLLVSMSERPDIEPLELDENLPDKDLGMYVKGQIEKDFLNTVS
jgi:hypothetical protein